MKEYKVTKLVKSEDLNHHGTLFAGRTAEWFVESSFIAASATVGDPKKVVCVNVNEMKFKTPVQKGEIITFTSKVAYVGRSSIIVYTNMKTELRDAMPVEGYITFACIDENGKKLSHGLVLDDTNDENELKIRERAKNF